MNDRTSTSIRNEITSLRANGITDILVSVNANGEATWGDATALERAEMEQAMEAAGYATDGMLTAEEFESRF